QELDLRRGVLVRTVRFEDASGRRSTLVERRIVSMAQMHLAALELTLTAENWSGRVTVRSGIDGRVVNDGAKLYRRFNKQHLEAVTSGSVGKDGVYLCVRTSQSNLHVAEAVRTRAHVGGTAIEPRRRAIDEPGYVAQELDVDLAQGESMVLEKLVALYTSRDHAISEPVVAACKAIERAGRFAAVFSRHTLAWQQLWRRFDVHLAPRRGASGLNVPMLL